jgi:Protein of unknown function (DUF664)
MSDMKAELHGSLQASRSGLLSKLEGLSEYDLRRPMTPTGTNLLGLAKHLAGLEYGYLGESLNRPAPETMSWVEDGSIWEGRRHVGDCQRDQRVPHWSLPARLRARRPEHR